MNGHCSTIFSFKKKKKKKKKELDSGPTRASPIFSLFYRSIGTPFSPKLRFQSGYLTFKARRAQWAALRATVRYVLTGSGVCSLLIYHPILTGLSPEGRCGQWKFFVIEHFFRLEVKQASNFVFTVFREFLRTFFVYRRNEPPSPEKLRFMLN